MWDGMFGRFVSSRRYCRKVVVIALIGDVVDLGRFCGKKPVLSAFETKSVVRVEVR